ncbi:MAG: spiro-SPASM protein [Alkalispirochaeta sp.]
MDRIVVAGFTVTPYLTTAFSDGTTPIERIIAAVSEIASRLQLDSDVTLITAPLSEDEANILRSLPLPAGWTHLSAPDQTASAVYRRLDESVPQDTEHLLFFRIDAPLVDPDLTERLYRLQHDSWCDYTFADGYPTGQTPEILRRELLPVLIGLSEGTDLSWKGDVLFDTLQKDINAFDIETEAAPEDYAILRASFTVDTRRNYLLCRRVVEKGDTAAAHREILLKEPHVLRVLPAYYYVQITTEMSQVPTYTPWNDSRWAPASPGAGVHMPVPLWTRVLDEIAEATPEAVVAIGYRGEPALHPQLPRLILDAEKHPGLRLYIETSGIGWSTEVFQAVTRSKSVDAVIVELDSPDPSTYRKLRGDGMDEAIACVEELRRLVPGKVYVQATRMPDNEWELQEFYKSWTAVPGVTVIIQKYNAFAQRLPDRRVADLSPLHRMPCRHLERDMVILVDGSVPRCHQDIDGEEIRGSLADQSVSAIWSRGASDYLNHIRGEYPAMCAVCDEYYTFNA